MSGMQIDAFEAIKALTWLASPSGLMVLGLLMLALLAGLGRISWLQSRAARGLARARVLAWVLVLQLPVLSVPFVAQGLAGPLEERARELAAGAPQIDFDARPATPVPAEPAPPAAAASDAAKTDIPDAGTTNAEPAAMPNATSTPSAASTPAQPDTKPAAAEPEARPAAPPSTEAPAPVVVDDMPRFDAIVVLGGAMRPALAGKRQFADLLDAGDRVWHAARLYRTGVAPLVVVSGAGDLIDGQMTPPESESMRDLLIELGVPQAAIVLESASRNTRQNAELTAALLRARQQTANQGAAAAQAVASPDAGSPANVASSGDKLTVALVTSAMHMPRAMSEFRKAGLPADAYPTDWQVVSGSLPWWRLYLPSGEGLHLAERSIKEWFGRVRAEF